MRQYLFPSVLASALTLSSLMFAEGVKDIQSEKRERAAFHLGQKETPENISLLVEIIKNPKETLRIKLEAVSSLMQMESPTAFSALVTTLKDRSQQPSEVRALAAAALGATGDPNAVHPLLETLEDEQELVVKWKILKALGALGTNRSLEVVEMYAEPRHPILLKKTALHVLAEHKKDGVLEKLLVSLQETEDLDFQTSIVLSLAELHDPRAEEPLKMLYASTKLPEKKSCCLSMESPGPELKLKIAILKTLGRIKSDAELQIF